MLEVTLYSELEAEHPQERQLITQAAQAAFALFDFPFDAGVDVTLVDDEGIRSQPRHPPD